MEVKTIPIGEIAPSPKNPRKTFEEDALKELADNIRQQGLIQPITVRPLECSGTAGIYTQADMGIKYELVCGERRYRAVKMLNAEDRKQFQTIASIVRELNDDEAFEAMITENLQRKDVDPTEEAYAFNELIKRGATAEEVAARFGKSVRFVQDRVKLNNLIPELMLRLKERTMTIVAAMIISKFDEDMQRKFYDNFNNYIQIGKSEANRFVASTFRMLRFATWWSADGEDMRDYAGGCGRKCSECHLNTANANCLFFDEQSDDADWRCTSAKGYLDKHIAYLLTRLESCGDNIVRKGGELEFGKSVIVDTCSCYSEESKHVHEETIKALEERGYEVINPQGVFDGRMYLREEEAEEKLQKGEVYRCIDVFHGNAMPVFSKCYYYIKRAVRSNDRGAIAPPKVTSLVTQYQQNIKAANEKIIKDNADLARSMGIMKHRGSLSPEEQIAFDMLILKSINNYDFFSHHYNIQGATTNKDIRDIIANGNAYDRGLWYREFIREKISAGGYEGSLNAEVCSDMLYLWSREKKEEVERKAIANLTKKNDKIKAELETLGYDVHGKKLVEDVVPKFPNREPLKAQFTAMKRRHPDALLLFRVGDNYEAFEDDAVALADILGLKVEHSTNMGEEWSVCRFPSKDLDEQLPKIIRAGHRTAICEQKDN